MPRKFRRIRDPGRIAGYPLRSISPYLVYGSNRVPRASPSWLRALHTTLREHPATRPSGTNLRGRRVSKARRAYLMLRDESRGESFDLNDFLPYRLSTLTNRISRAFATLYSEQFDLTIPEWRVMAVLGQASGLSADQACARTEMDKVTVSRAVARLLEKGYVAREFASADRRRSVLALSTRGRAIHRKIIPLAREYEAALGAGLSPAERRTLVSLLEKLRP